MKKLCSFVYACVCVYTFEYVDVGIFVIYG